MKNLTDEISLIEENSYDCDECQKKATSSIFLIKESIPYKLFTIEKCLNCGFMSQKQEDYIKLLYSIEIECTFNDKIQNSRFLFINNLSQVYIYRENKEIMNFNCENTFVDTVETLILRSIEMIENNKNEIIQEKVEDLKKCVELGKLQLRIKDDSGYSRVCPLNKEYIEIQNYKIENLNEKGIVEHKKIINRI